MKHISERELQLPDAQIGRLLKIAVEDHSVISMSVGEPDFITPKPLLRYAKKMVKYSTHYTPTAGRRELREAIVHKLKKDNNIDTNPENIILTTGSQQAVFTALLTTIDPTEQVIIPSPSYLAYVPQIELVSGTPVYFKLDEENDFEVNPDDIKKVIDRKKSKVLLINTPGNPTGTVLSKKILEEIADIAVEYDLYVFSDEAYEKLIYDRKHISIGSLNGMKNYVVTFQTFSKSYAMCGFRLGYAAGPENLIKEMTKASHYVTLAPPTLSQLVAVKALSLNPRYTNKMVKEYRRRRDFLVKRLNEIGLPTKMPYGAFYTFSNILEFSRNSLRFTNDILRKAKVAVVPGSEFGKYGEGYIRCSYATDFKLIEKAMDRIDNFLRRG